MHCTIKDLANDIVENLDRNKFEGVFEAEEPFEGSNEIYDEAIISWSAEMIGDKVIVSIDEATGFSEGNSIEETDITFSLKELNKLVNDML